MAERFYTPFAVARQIYLRANPSVDLKEVKEPINPGDYRLKISEYEMIMEEFGIKAGTDDYADWKMWMLNRGPQLIDE